MKYDIKYRIIFSDNSVSEDHEIKINNCYSNSHARIKLEKYLQKKYDNFKKLIVDKCFELTGDPLKDNFKGTIFEDLLNGKKNNPFNNPFSGKPFNNIF